MIVPTWVYPTAAAALLAIGFAGGWQVQGWRTAARHTAALEAAHKAYERRLATINEKAREYETDREAARVESNARQTQIRTIYRDVPVPAECEPPAGVRDVLTEAVRAANTGQPGG